MSQPDSNVRILDKDELKTLMAQAAREGAQQALDAVGLGDKEALADLQTLRSLAKGIREAKKEVWRTIGRALLWLIVAGLATTVFGPKIAGWLGYKVMIQP